MTNIDIGVMVLFTILIFACGMSFSKSGKNMKSFFAAGGALPWWMSGLSLFMSFFSAGTFVTWGSIAYSSGLVAVTIQWTMCIAGLLIGFFIAPRWQKTKSLTAAEYIKNRLGLQTQKTYTYIFLAIAAFSTGSYLYPVAKIVEVSTGIPITASILAIGVMILVYTAVGGLWAVIITDILQFVVLTAVVLIVLPLAFDKIGGIQHLISDAPEGFYSLVNEEYSWEFIVAFGFYNLFFIAGNWAYVQRYTSVATPRDAQKAAWLFSGLYAISPVIWMLPPMIYRILNPELEGLADEGAYLLMCKEVLPLGMLGLMLGGMVFATSSSVNTSLNISAGVLTNDVYKIIKPTASEKELVKVGRIATIILGMITIIVALLVPYLGGVVEFVFSMAALTGGALFLPPIWALFSRYQIGKTILATTIITLLVNVFFKFIAPSLINLKLNRAEEMTLGVVLPIVLLALFEIYLRLQKKEAPQYQKYVEIVEQKVTATEEEPAADNRRGTRVIGFGILATGVLILALSLIAGNGILPVAIMGLVITVFGGLILQKNRNRSSDIPV